MGSIAKPSKVVFIGAAGEMCRIAVERFALASEASLVLADINTTVVDSLVAKLPKGRATSRKLDLFDRDALRDTIKGAALVVLGAGPYTRTSGPVIDACFEAGIPYLDFDDDVESTEAALRLHEKAEKAGVPFYIGCGASPGMSNVMAVDVAKELDTVDELELCWLVGDERPGVGRAVLEHLMHIAAGPCLTWADGKATIHETWVETTYAPMFGKSGETLLHETAHPEPVTLPRLFPKATRIRCMGGLDPAPFNGIARGLGSAVRSKALTLDAAVDFLFNLINNPPSHGGWGDAFGALVGQLRGGDITLKELFQLVTHATDAIGPWRHALQGMIEQIWTGECSTSDVLGFIISSARGQTAVYRSGLLVRAVGTRNGHPAVVIKRTPHSGKESILQRNMGTVTGTSCAAFMVMALEASEKRGGVFCPEDWAEPATFYKTLEKLGIPSNDIIESLTS